MQTLFISDLHLCDDRPEKIQLFKEFLRSLSNDVEALYILGDLFEFWHGDDDDNDSYLEILQSLNKVSKRGIKLYIQRGNRDFLLGIQFQHRTGALILPDPFIIKLYGNKVLIMHGDLLCSDDKSYQNFRKITNNQFLQAFFVLLPLFIRKMIAKKVRSHSKQTVKTKPPEIMDVTQSTVEQYMNHYGVYDLIHGHTHRRGDHNFLLNGNEARRIVLGDWYGEDSVLVYEQDRQELLRIKDYLK